MTTDADVIVAVYGSTARGDADSHSDLDVLILGDASLPLAQAAIPDGAHCSRYSWQEWLVMRSEGSVFLRHIAAESRVFWHAGDGLDRFKDSLVDLPSYKNVRRDIEAFKATLQSIESELTEDDCCIYFELNVLAMVVRHISILVCYLVGDVSFSRVASMRIAASATECAQGLAADFEELYDFRLAFQHRKERPVGIPSIPEIRSWILEARALLASAEELATNARCQ